MAKMKSVLHHISSTLKSNGYNFKCGYVVHRQSDICCAYFVTQAASYECCSCQSRFDKVIYCQCHKHMVWWGFEHYLYLYYRSCVSYRSHNISRLDFKPTNEYQHECQFNMALWFNVAHLSLLLLGLIKINSLDPCFVCHHIYRSFVPCCWMDLLNGYHISTVYSDGDIDRIRSIKSHYDHCHTDHIITTRCSQLTFNFFEPKFCGELWIFQ